MTLEQTNAVFSTTNWTLLERLRDGTEPERRAAMDAVVRAYWPPVYGALRRMGRGREEAAELTQAFFANVVLERSLPLRADAARGRWRTLILAALRNFLVDQHRQRRSNKDLSALGAADLDREEEFLAAVPDASVDQIFDRRWALALVERALSRCEAHCRQTGRSRNWEAFSARVLVPAVGTCEAVPLAEVARSLGFSSSADAAAAVQSVKRHVMTILGELTAETVADRSGQDMEFACLKDLLREASGC